MTQMKRILAASLLLLLVAGCQQTRDTIGVLTSTFTNPVSDTNLYQAELVFDGSVKTFNELKGLCVRRVLPPVCRTYVAKGQDIIRKAAAADLTARRFIETNPTVNAVSLVSAFKNTVADFNVNLTSLSQLKK